ncbi:MAG TPA: DUF4156 domain-containing protein [Gammaproteobacteria bacterium]|nr:DUF4156 domain-containing protein [Gammaproteobacteria bacterium]
MSPSNTKPVRHTAALALLAALGGCTWVTPSPEAQGADIAVVDATTAARCQLLTQNQLTVDAKLGVLQRMPTDVEHDLETMAVNQAASVGANAVAALSPAKDGVQTWGIYKCPAGVKSAAAPSATTAPAASTGVKTLPYTPPR